MDKKKNDDPIEKILSGTIRDEGGFCGKDWDSEKHPIIFKKKIKEFPLGEQILNFMKNRNTIKTDPYLHQLLIKILKFIQEVKKNER